MENSQLLPNLISAYSYFLVLILNILAADKMSSKINENLQDLGRLTKCVSLELQDHSEQLNRYDDGANGVYYHSHFF